MKKATLKKWKRDALETEWDYKSKMNNSYAKEAVRQARRVTELLEEIESLVVLYTIESDST